MEDMVKKEYLREDLESKLGQDRCALRELLFKIINEVTQLQELEDDCDLYSRYDLDQILNEANDMRDKSWEWEPGVSEDED